MSKALCLGHASLAGIKVLSTMNYILLDQLHAILYLACPWDYLCRGIPPLSWLSLCLDFSDSVGNKRLEITASPSDPPESIDAATPESNFVHVYAEYVQNPRSKSNPQYHAHQFKSANASCNVW